MVDRGKSLSYVKKYYAIQSSVVPKASHQAICSTMDDVECLEGKPD